MKRIVFTIFSIYVFNTLCFSHDVELGQKFKFNFATFNQQEVGLKRSANLSIQLPVEGNLYTFILTRNTLSTANPEIIKTYDGKTADRRNKIKLSVFPDRVEGIISTAGGYYLFEAVDIESNDYRIYNMSEVPRQSLECGTEEHEFSESLQKINPGKIRSTQTALFPFGDNMRIFRMAAAATGEMTSLYGTKEAAIAQIVSIINTTNMIYQQELGIRFQLIDKTTDGTIIYENAETDPFPTPNPSYASAARSQTGFNAMNTSAVLPYDLYDVGHTFHTNPKIGGYSIGGEAGSSPCADGTKSRGWTEWSLDSPLGAIVNIFAHELGHQFSAWHTYNATGGRWQGDPFCTSGWSSVHAVEPGGGSTLMAYGNNCSHPTNQTLTGENTLSYFHIKSIEAIQEYLASASCFTTEPTGNTPPTADAGEDITIPKRTPFWLNGIADDADGDTLSYTWEQNDVALSADMGALGHLINGVYGYPATKSTTAPLFRSEQSATTDRTFPKLKFILNDENKPDDLEGEALSEVARAIKLRFTVRDGKSGVNVDEITVNVAECGPLEVMHPNGANSFNANDEITVTWAVNSTNTLSPNVNILLSVDGGLTFPYTLAENTPNDGTQNVTIPNVPSTGKARIKVVAIINPNANFFDISNANFSISSTCQSYSSIPGFAGDVSAKEGEDALNLNLSALPPAQNQVTLSGNTAKGTPIYIRENEGSNNCICPLTNAYVLPSQKHKFKVTKSGSYTFTNSISTSPTSTILTLLNAENGNCDNFMGSAAYSTGGNGFRGTVSFSATLSENTDYYLMGIHTASTFSWNITITGAGDAYTESAPPAGISYAYIAVNKIGNLVEAVSPTADFRILNAGNYTVYGISYPTTDASEFIGNTLNAIQAGNCVVPSMNSINMTVTTPVTGISENSDDNELVLYPSPANNYVYIKSKINIDRVEILNYSGQVVRAEKVQQAGIPLSGLLPGYYIVKLYSASGKEYYNKLIKE